MDTYRWGTQLKLIKDEETRRAKSNKIKKHQRQKYYQNKTGRENDLWSPYTCMDSTCG